MQKKYTSLIGFGLIVALTFGVGFKLGQHSEVLNPYSQSKKLQQMDSKLSLLLTKSNQAAAILVMPKSYLPLLEKFKHRKIARAIKILPAHIGWDDGEMVAIPKKAILRSTAVPLPPNVNISHRSQIKGVDENFAKTNMVKGAAFLFLLKSTAQSKLGYVAHQP